MSLCSLLEVFTCFLPIFSVSHFTEPEGIVEIKFRRDKVAAVMERLDETYASLKAASNDSTKSSEERAKSAEQLKAREAFLQPTYLQIAHLYADLHE